MKLRSIELDIPAPQQAAEFMVDIWGLAMAETVNDTVYLRGSGPFPYLIALHKGKNDARTITFVCDEDEMEILRQRVKKSGLNACETKSSDLGGGQGILVEMSEGPIFRFLTGTTETASIEGRDLPEQLTHVVLNAIDAELCGDQVEEVFGFTVSDRTKGMVFVRCNNAHHSTAFARSGFSSLNHIAFQMVDSDAVMRGIGRLRDYEMVPSWGPGRHGPGDNVFAYFLAPFGPVIEFSTAVETVPDDYKTGAPEDWTWPDGRIDQWGLSDKDFDGIRTAEKKFTFNRTWTPSAL